MKLAPNEFIALKSTNKPNFYYGRGGGELRYARLFKTLRHAKEAQSEAKKEYSHDTKLVLLTITEKDFTENE